MKCAHCGREFSRREATVDGQSVCHVYEPGVPEKDCYRLVTLYGETLGSRKVGTP